VLLKDRSAYDHTTEYEHQEVPAESMRRQVAG